MDIHQQIKAAREKLGWSMEKLASEVSTAEGLAKPLSWQTVQQWESGASAPKRTRMALVQRLLGIDRGHLVVPEKGDVFQALNDAERSMLKNYRLLLDKDRKAIDAEVAAKAEERQAELDEFFARYGVAKALERSNARRSDHSSTVVDPEDPRLKQQELPLVTKRD